jgi:hypothetical protein
VLSTKPSLTTHHFIVAASYGSEVEGMADTKELVTIERYRETLEADLAQTRLESAGIASFLAGEETAVLYGTGLGGLQLQVSAEDEADARSILNDPGPLDGEVSSVS